MNRHRPVLCAAASVLLGMYSYVSMIHAQQKPSQSLSLNINELPVARFLYGMADAAYHPNKFADPKNGRAIGRKDTGIGGGFQALAVEYQFGPQQIVIISYAGTNVLSSDILADIRLGSELLVNAQNPDLRQAERIIATDTSYNFLDSQIKDSLEFYRDVQGRSNAPIILIGHSLGGFLAEIVSAKYDVKSVTFEAPQVARTILSRFGLNQAGHESSIHFVRATDPVASRWPNTPDVLGRRVQLVPRHSDYDSLEVAG
jgi:Lipase (class 3)